MSGRFFVLLLAFLCIVPGCSSQAGKNPAGADGSASEQKLQVTQPQEPASTAPQATQDSQATTDPLPTSDPQPQSQSARPESSAASEAVVMTPAPPPAVNSQAAGGSPAAVTASPEASTNKFNEARKKLQTKIVSEIPRSGPPEVPPKSSPFQLIRYTSPVGKLAAYVTKDPRDGKRHPAIIWITGGDSNEIGDVWSPAIRDLDQSASAFRKAGIVMMFPSLRGGNDNPGVREGFLGEVDDILAATDHLAKLPYVDPQQIYLGGHSTGGTLVMLVGAASDRYRAIFALGPVAFANQYDGEYVYGDTSNRTEVVVRSPSFWLDSIQSPMYVIEGDTGGNWNTIRSMLKKNKNPQIRFLKIPKQTHFSVIAPVAEKLAPQIIAGQVTLTEADAETIK